MSKQSPERELLVERAARAAADFGAAAGAVDEQARAVLGINPTDASILAVLYEREQLTAGEAAAAIRLSPAATSTAIQRLVAAGHLTRTPDPADRRRAVLVLTEATRTLLAAIYEPIGDEGTALLADYTDDELRVVTRFLERGRALQLAHADRVRALR
ncbi:MarR family winged helix-turn-helix transcriptional regulator [Cryptosporangium aurantiacum]|uniref:MarR family winged helix-turn-helix transcriptional regulator n=1 Tax=Cryptosporangium aurantiacum TaxID=134849 RepID=UPI000935020E|nr:MarR family transcriptional regulator [Cryptosporangium aurantiacum]